MQPFNLNTSRPLLTRGSITAILLILNTSVIAAEIATFRGETMGTTFTIHVVPQANSKLSPAAQVDEAQLQVQTTLERVNSLMSTYRQDSELSRFNASRSTEWFPVSSETATVVLRALEISQMSAGLFDPTVGRLVRLWHFGPDPGELIPPTEEQITAALANVGYQHLSVSPQRNAVRKSLPDLEVDLSAIAKGYGVDALVAQLQQLGFESGMVEIGGEVRTFGTKPNGQPWRIAIERPDAKGRSIERVLELLDASLATSGDYRNFYSSGGQRFSHTIDPTTGRPTQHNLASVSVLAPDCMSADALATAFMALGPERGMALANAHGIAALFLLRSGGTTANETFVTQLSQAGTQQFQFVDTAALTNLAAPGLWTTLLITIGIFSLAIAGLAIGVILAKRPLRGSCGGINALGERTPCQLCSKPPEECDEFRKRLQQAAPADHSNDTSQENRSD